jgi:hypothetical protein
MRAGYALPSEHGAWALWLGPLAVGLGVGGWRGGPTLCLVAAQAAAFLSRHPLTLLAKTVSGRRSRVDAAPAVAWLTIYSTVAVALGISVIAMGYPALWWAALPVVPTAIWQAWLVRRRAERQMALELAGSGVLALAAPTAYYVGRGSFDATAVVLWIVCWFQAAGAIVYVYLRLAQRRLKLPPPRSDRLSMGGRALSYATFNLVGSIALAVWHAAPPLVPVAFAAMLVQAIAGVVTPAVGARPQRLGFEQTTATAVFSALLIAAYRL